MCRVEEGGVSCVAWKIAKGLQSDFVLAVEVTGCTILLSFWGVRQVLLRVLVLKF